MNISCLVYFSDIGLSVCYNENRLIKEMKKMNGIRHIEFVALPETLEEFKALPQAEMLLLNKR